MTADVDGAARAGILLFRLHQSPPRARISGHASTQHLIVTAENSVSWDSGQSLNNPSYGTNGCVLTWRVIRGMSRSFIFIATVGLTASLSISCCAQESATTDTTQMSREEWQAHVMATRERLGLMRRERKGIVSLPPTQDELAQAASKRVLEDDLRPGDIVSTKAGLFRFRGSPDRERKPEDFERLR